MRLLQRIHTKHFWKKVLLRLASLPGYAALFSAWVTLLGLVIVPLYLQFFDATAVDKTADPKPVSSTTGYWEVILVAGVGLAAWSSVAYFTGKLLRIVATKFKISSKHLLAFKLGLVGLGWLVLTAILALLFPETDYAILIFGGVLMAIGSLSFGLEAALLNILGLKQSDTW